VAFPFYYSAVFTSVEYPKFEFSQSDFFELRDFVKRNHPDIEYTRNEFNFTFEKVFGFLSFNILVKYSEKKLRYSLNMMSVIFSVILVLFLSLFIAQGSLTLSLIIGLSVFVVVYVFSVLIVNGMVRKVLEDFVIGKIKKYELEIKKAICERCGKKVNTGEKICSTCLNGETTLEEDEIIIKYSYKESRKS
jgi:ribosomal protein L37E